MSLAEDIRDFGPPPPSSLTLDPTAEEIAFFEENGFLVVDRITTDEEIAWLAEIADYVFSGDFQGAGAPVDRSGARLDDEPVHLSQAFFPEVHFPGILQSTFHRNAKRYATKLLNEPIEALTGWGHMIHKPAHHGRAALWHQDEAYWEPELAYHALGAWLPLHDVTVEMGCMQFVPGSHKGEVLMHHHFDAPENNVLGIDESFDTSTAVACPLKAGGCTFHHSRTLHHTAPNTTDRDRIAFPTEFQIDPTWLDEPRDQPWVRERRAVVGEEDVAVMVGDGKFRRVKR